MPKKRTRESSQDNIEYYQRKIKKLENEQKRKRRRILIESSSDSDDIESLHSALSVNVEANATTIEDPMTQQASNDIPDENLTPTAEAPIPSQEDSTCPELDPELLIALGEETDSTPKLGEKIHHSLAQRWVPILKKGLSKEAKDKLFKDYLVPENCSLLQAPKLNHEVSAAISEASRHRDKRKEAEQQQLGVGISAINKALTIMLTSDNKIEAIRIMSDGCRILTDLHYQETQSRISVINYALAKPFLNVVQDCERDKTLYGNKLGEKIKASKTIEKQGMSIKKFSKGQKGTPTTEPVTTNSRLQYQYRQPGTYQGNWSGPSRFHQNRGGAERSEQGEHSHESPASTSTPADVERGRCEQAEDTCDAPITQISSPYPGCRSTLRQAFSRRGIPESALDLMLASLSNNTMQQYNVSFKLWWQYCASNNHNFFDCSVPIVLCFLSEQYNKGSSYGTLNSHRSALSLLLGSNIGSDDRIKRLLKGAFKLKPSFPKYCTTWDTQIVLNYVSNLYPNRTLNREKITKKLVILLSLCTAQRVQTLSLIKLENISIGSSGINITIKDIIKTSAAGREQPTLFLPYFTKNLSICPATTLEDYLNVTNKDRPANVSNLLITVKRPYKGATAQSISRWIKQILAESGVDVTAFSAHSTRHAATSAAAAAGVSVDTIRKAAGWTNASKVFAQYYHRPIIDDNNFAQAILHNDDSS